MNIFRLLLTWLTLCACNRDEKPFNITAEVESRGLWYERYEEVNIAKSIVACERNEDKLVEKPLCNMTQLKDVTMLVSVTYHDFDVLRDFKVADWGFELSEHQCPFDWNPRLYQRASFRWTKSPKQGLVGPKKADWDCFSSARQEFEHQLTKSSVGQLRSM